jgi:hypothetical protein
VDQQQNADAGRLTLRRDDFIVALASAFLGAAIRQGWMGVAVN